MFPYVHSEDWGSLDTGNSFTHQRAVLIGGRANFQLTLVDNEPSPSATKSSCTRSRKFFLERIVAAEGRFDIGEQSTAGFAASVPANYLPEERVVNVATCIVADGSSFVVGNDAQVLDQFFCRLRLEWGSFDCLDQIVDVCLVMLAMVDFHS